MTAIRPGASPESVAAVAGDLTAHESAAADAHPIGAVTGLTDALNSARHVGSLVRRLRGGASPTAIQVFGDSTSTYTTQFVYRLGEWLAEQFPAYTFLYRRWSDAAQAYEPEIVLSTGINGLRRFTTSGAWTDMRFFVADSAATSPTTDLDVRVRVKIGDPIAVNWTIASKWGGSGARSWRFELSTNGRLALYISADGTNAAVSVATPNGTLTAEACAGVNWLRFTFDGDNGAGGSDTKFYISSDGEAWTQLGATITKTTSTIFDADYFTQLNGYSSANVKLTSGTEIYAMKVFTNLDGTAPAIDLDFGSYGSGTSFTDYVGNTVTINNTTGSITGAPTCVIYNASVPSMSFAYHSDDSRFALETPHKAHLVITNCGLNDRTTPDIRAQAKALTDKVLAKWPDTGVVVTLENALRTSDSYAVGFTIRTDDLAAFAVEQGFSILDVYRAFINAGDIDALVDETGHPTQDGYDLQTATAIALFAAWAELP